MPAERPTLAVIPARVSTSDELDGLLRCLVTIWTTTDASDTIAMVIDDASPDPSLVDRLEVAIDELGYLLHRQEAEGGVSRAVNVGLAHARSAEADAVVIDAAVEFSQAGWLDVMRARTDTQGRPAAVVGARLLYPDGLIAHGGVYFSLLRRHFFPRFQFAPADLPEALVPTRCPVSSALMLVRHETLRDVGLHDEDLGLELEGVDYCLQTFRRGLDCVYEPAALARHHEPVSPAAPSAEHETLSQRSLQRMLEKWSGTDLREWIPDTL